MSAKAIYETNGKCLLTKWLQNSNFTKNKFAVVVHDTNWDETVKENPWIATEVGQHFHLDQSLRQWATASDMLTQVYLFVREYSQLIMNWAYVAKSWNERKGDLISVAVAVLLFR